MPTEPAPFRPQNPTGPAYRRGWVDEAVAAIEADQCRTADTHLIRLIVPALAGIDIYLKDESTHPTGSLKHRLARSLFLYALCNGQIGEATPVVEASSGSTAVSEAYFAQMIGVPFYAVTPRALTAITWISSPLPNGPPTGAATTTSPSRSFPSLRESRARSRPGS